jgi:hypothetical protein
VRFLDCLPLLGACAAISTPAAAQSFNVDVGANSTFPVPSAAYGAGAGQTGTWNARNPMAASAMLTDVTGAATPVSLARTGAALGFEFDDPGTTGDDQNLMDDIHDVGAVPAAATWTFSGLQAGMYALYTYAWAPDDATFVSSVNGGSIDPAQACGGAWPGSQMQGVTYARHRYTVAAGGSIAVTITGTSGYASVNGFQLVEMVGTPATGFCFGDGTATACPCGNIGAAGNGCPNSLNPSGANLAGNGLASVSADTFVLEGTGMPSSSALYFQGLTQQAGGSGAVLGDGLRCAGGAIIRLGTKTNAGGLSQYPVAGDLAISVRGMVPGAGGARTYQIWYRNAASFCNPETFNLSNGLQVTWIP